MASNIIKSAPYTVYRYFVGVEHFECKSCHHETDHYLLRYRNYLFSKYPFIPTNTQFFLICSACHCMTELEGEGVQMPYVFKARQKDVHTYTKNDILDLQPEIISKTMTSETLFEENIKAHLIDLSKK